MKVRLLFYCKYSLRSLRRDGRLSLFAMFAIAAGVASIVALQSLSLSIAGSVAKDVQTTHQADIVVATKNEDPFRPHKLREFQDLASQGRFVEWTYFYWVNPDRPSFVAPAEGTGSEPVPWLQPYLIEPNKYPLYGEIISSDPKDVPLGQLLTSPGDVVLSEGVADRLGLNVGDGVVLENSATFLVKGVVPNQASGGVFAPFHVPPMPWFAYLDLHDARAKDAFGVEEGDANVLFIRTENEDDAEALASDIRSMARNVNVETAADRLTEIRDITDSMRKFIILAGLAALAIGSLGIYNAMRVVVGRRNTEVSILKALGLKGRGVIFLFMLQGTILGMVGSFVGVLLGVLVSYGLIGFGERFLQADLSWQVQPQAIYTGLVVGVIATTIFGFFPILSASRVRPNVVLQVQASVLPQTGRLLSLGVVLFLTAVMGLVASWFLDSLLIGILGAYGALVVLALLVLAFLGVVWVIGKSPDFRSINLKLALMGLSRQRGRAASILLALVVGLFAMASILILGGGIKQLIDETVEDFVGGNVFVLLSDTDSKLRDRAFREISSVEGLTNLVEYHLFTRTSVVAINGQPYQLVAGSRLTPEALPFGGEPPLELPSGVTKKRLETEPTRRFNSTLIARSGVPADNTRWNTAEIAQGRGLGPEDVGRPVVVASARPWWRLGDELSFVIGGKEVSLEIVGITLEESPIRVGFEEGEFLAPLGALDPAIPRSSISFRLTVPPSEASAVAAQLSQNVPEAIAGETVSMASVFKAMLDRIAGLPAILSSLALIAGAVIIADSVALATMERRREFAIMKAVGAKGLRILTILLMEHAILGLAGGVISVVLSMIVLAFLHRLEPQVPVVPDSLSIIIVLATGVGVTLAAAVLSAWPASRQKPLSVLRYE